MSEITQDAVDIVQKHVADRWLHFGRALLKTDNTGVRDITSKLSGSDPTAPRGIFEKLRRVLEAWVEKRGKNKSPPTRVQLQEACRAEGILGGAEMTYDSYCGKGAGMLNSVVRSQCLIGNLMVVLQTFQATTVD